MTAPALAGCHAVVTGGGRGIGRAIAGRLAALGASLSLVGRDRSKLYEAVQSLPAGTNCDAHACDVADAEAVNAAFAAIARAGHRVSILVNNAGVAKSARVAATDDALWGEMLAVNLSGTFHCIRAALPALLEAKAGRVVNVASTAGVIGYPYVAAYCAAKHGVVGLTRALALELGPHGIRVNAIAPTVIVTDLNRELVRTQPRLYQAVLDRTPLGRLGEPEDIAGALVFLASPAARFVTGQTLFVDGGYTAG